MSNLIFHQLFEHETGTYTYLLGDSGTQEAVLIDPVLEMVDRDLKLVAELGLRVVLVLDTHIHADHVTAAAEIRKRTGAKTGVSAAAQVEAADLALVDGQKISLGSFDIEVLATPGHTDSCLSFHCEGMVFTGDALLIRGTGRTDFQQGSSDRLYDSVHGKLFALPDATKVYPGHDYRGFTSSSIGLERNFNPRLGGGKTRAEFTRIMAELKLDQPKRIHEAVPANLAGGVRATGPDCQSGLLEKARKR
jgi:sulfur dioxygenase